MMQIWIYINGMQQGPYTVEQLKVMGIGRDTPVWYEGLPDWIKACDSPLLAPLFAANAAASGFASQAKVDENAAPERPRTYLVWNIILTVLCCNVFALAGIITGVFASSRYNAGNYRGAKRLAEATEWLLILALVWLVIGGPVMLAVSLM